MSNPAILVFDSMGYQSEPRGMTEDRQEERQLIAEYLETGDDRLFEVLVERYKERVFRVALSVLGPYRVPEAEDVTQEVFFRTHRKLAAFRHESRLGTWLYRMSFNLAIDQTRRMRYHRPHVSEETLETRPATSDAADPHQQAVRRELGRAVQTAMARMPVLHRSVLYFHYWLDCSVAETAESLGIPAGSVKSYLQRGRAQLYKMLVKRGWNHD